MPTIPKEYGNFEKATLIAVTDSTRAKLLRAEGSTIELIEEFSSGYPPKEHGTRTSGRAPSGVHFAEKNEKERIISRDRLYGSLVSEIEALLEEGRFEDLVLCAPEEHLGELRESMPLPLLKKTVASIPKLLTGEDWLDVALHVQEELPKGPKPRPEINPHEKPIQRAKNRNRGRTPESP
jgi:protein required for attachment to host cells